MIPKRLVEEQDQGELFRSRLEQIVNPDHPLLRAMGDIHKQDNKAPALSDYADLLYDQALLTEGSPIRDPLRFTRLVSDLMVKAAQ